MKAQVLHNEHEESLDLVNLFADTISEKVIGIIDLPGIEFDRLINCSKRDRCDSIFRILGSK